MQHIQHTQAILNNYNISTTYIKGKENKVADALSRRVNELYSTTINMYQTDLKDGILEAAKEDTHYMEMVTKLQQGKML